MRRSRFATVAALAVSLVVASGGGAAAAPGEPAPGTQEYLVRLNSSSGVASELNDMPVRTVNGTTVYVKDVANVRNSFFSIKSGCFTISRSVDVYRSINIQWQDQK